MLLVAARLRDTPAIFLVIQEVLRHGSLRAPGVNFIYRSCFQPLVQKGLPKALYLEGQLCEAQGKNERAFDLYQRLIAGNAERPASIEYEVDYGAVWMAISKFKARKGDRTGSEEAIHTAAFQHDNPAAYYELAKVFTKSASSEYESFLLKAAASGEVEASHELGVLYFSQSQGQLPIDDRSASDRQGTSRHSRKEEEVLSPEGKLAMNSNVATNKRTIAREWFALGADAGLTGSQVYLAALLHEVGKFDEGWQWLEAASKSKGSSTWSKVITFLRKHWNLAHSDFSRLNIEVLRKGLDSKTCLMNNPTLG